MYHDTIVVGNVIFLLLCIATHFFGFCISESAVIFIETVA